jgi:hypothetical protein
MQLSDSPTFQDGIQEAKDYADAQIAAAVAGLFEYKGGIDCSANPNYPAANRGDSYLVTIAGRIGGASGTVVEVGDFVFANADSAAGDEATVGANWDVLQANLSNLPTRTRVIPVRILSTLAASEILDAFTPPSGETWTFAADLGGAAGKKLSSGVNPAATFVIDLLKNGSVVGTITISTAGAVTFATSGGSPFSIIGGTDDLVLRGPASADIANGYVMSLVISY